MRKGMVMTNPLYWLPFPIDRWLGELAGGLRPDQKGALMDLLMTSWRQEPPCTLQNDAGYLAAKSGLGSSWKRLSGPIMANFEVGDDGRLICRWLREIYDEQLTKYQNRSHANKRNREQRDDGSDDDEGDWGTIRTDDAATNVGTNGSTIRTTNGGTIGTTNESTNGTENGTIRTTIRSTELRRKRGDGTTAPTEQVVPNHQLKGEKVPEDALGAEAPRASTAEGERRHQHGAALDEAYDQWLASRVERFRTAMPHLYDQHEANAISFQGWGGKGRQLTDTQKATLVATTAERIAKSENWPPRSAWIEWRQSPPAERNRYRTERNSALNAWGVAHPAELGEIEAEYAKLTRSISGKAGDEDKTKWVGDRIARVIQFPEFNLWRRRRQARAEQRPTVAAVG